MALRLNYSGREEKESKGSRDVEKKKRWCYFRYSEKPVVRQDEIITKRVEEIAMGENGKTGEAGTTTRSRCFWS